MLNSRASLLGLTLSSKAPLPHQCREDRRAPAIPGVSSFQALRSRRASTAPSIIWLLEGRLGWFLPSLQAYPSFYLVSSFNEYSLSTYYVPGTGSDTRETAKCRPRCSAGVATKILSGLNKARGVGHATSRRTAPRGQGMLSTPVGHRGGQCAGKSLNECGLPSVQH